MELPTDLLRTAAARLAAAGIDEPLREARILAREAADATAFETFLARRARREPVAYILGRKEFWSLEFEVSPAVLIPRPDSETLIETALEELKKNPPARILDLGTGSGCLIVALLTEWRNASGVAVDRSEEALAVARRNALRHGVAERLALRTGDWAAGIADRFDLVVANPPYIAPEELAALDPDVRDHEPRAALDGGAGGLAEIERIASDLPRILKPGGLALVEIGHAQGAASKRLFTKVGFASVRIVKDLAANDRVAVARLPQLPGA